MPYSHLNKGMTAIPGREPTPKEILSLMDSSGVPTNRRTCLLCSDQYTVGDAQDTGLCDVCSTNKMRNTRAVSDEVLPQGKQRCLLCAKIYEGTIGIGTRDMICPECRDTYRDTAILRCVRCHHVIGRLAPTVTDTGFQVKPGAVLSVDGCNICKDDLEGGSVILEMEEWMRHRKGKTYSRQR